MPPHPGPVLVDTNVIFECHRTSCWRALTSGYHLETTEDCVAETQAGKQHQEGRTEVDEIRLRESLSTVHGVSDRQRAELLLRQAPELDRGEQSLWAHALDREDDTWLFAGPDKASLRCGVLLGYRDRLVSLERLLDDIGHRVRGKLREAYTEAWHRRAVNELVLDPGL